MRYKIYPTAGPVADSRTVLGAKSTDLGSGASAPWGAPSGATRVW